MRLSATSRLDRACALVHRAFSHAHCSVIIFISSAMPFLTLTFRCRCSPPPSFGAAFANELRTRSSTMTKSIAWAEFYMAVHRRRAESCFVIGTLRDRTDIERYASIELTGNLVPLFHNHRDSRMEFRLAVGENFDITSQTLLLFFARAHLQVYGRVRTLGQIRRELLRDFRTIDGAIDSDTLMGLRSAFTLRDKADAVHTLEELHCTLRNDVISLIGGLPGARSATQAEFMRLVTC